MRYRIKEYKVTAHPVSRAIGLNFSVPAAVLDRLECEEGTTTLTDDSKRYITESIRLITDETKGGYVLMSTGQKDVLSSITESDGRIGIVFSKSALIEAADGDEDDIAAINAMSTSDQFTIEVDWGEEPMYAIPAIPLTNDQVETIINHVINS